MVSKSEIENIQKEKMRFEVNYFSAEIFCILVEMLKNDRLVDAFKLILYHSASNDGQTSDYSNLIKSCSRVLLLKCTSEIFKALYASKYDEIFYWAKILGHVATQVLEENDIVSKIAIKRIEAVRDELKASNRQAFLELESRFASLFAEISQSSICAEVDFDHSPDELEMIRAKRVAFEPMAWFIGNHAEDIACVYVKIRKSIETPPIKEWFMLVDTIQRTRNYNEKLFKDTEKKTLVINRN
jgi:hypothetical protein